MASANPRSEKKPSFHAGPAKGRIHYWLSALLALFLIPALRSQNLPLKFDWITLSVAYWLILAAQSIFVAVLLACIGLPHELRPIISRYRRAPLRIVAVLIYFLVLVSTTPWLKAAILTVDAVALLELFERKPAPNFGRTLLSILFPAGYLFLGFLLVFAYNSVIASARFNFATDPFLFSIDRWLLHGHSVCDFAHWAARTLPIGVLQTFESIYFGMFPQIGAAILLLALCNGRAEASRFVGTILTAYSIALILFYIWPAQGPYYLCPIDFASLSTYHIQRTLVAHGLARWHHDPVARISTDYFIALPCMHITQPLIVIWFLRRWKRTVLALAAYDLALVAAIILLQWHYIIDIIAGILVAAIAILITRSTIPRNLPNLSVPAGVSQ